ncbi:tail fiber assembly protein [Citrobacter sp. Cf140]|uniref:tail fiber assembly protein n=1 Tax=Citrobacter TaxID=544 RepID=UPI001A1BA9B4|nr:tail fiber assembly protein [Citrobacter sp. Cf140]MEB1122524.1 tail fiber assembly protein [Citrobacter freundii]MDM3099992.1 tail fiber assembly protein [Citrobacter sp. Cf140]HAU5659974.1 tail fiber assembly protein [Citrobacter freundii]HBV7900208.1 tail fiber assembly protein [Citrobacter freundii]HCB2471259.1 tail fiber assembly protein [Citrobacter freundii]
MQHLKNLKKYTPDDENSLFLINEHNVEFYVSEDGQDWYKSQANFSPDTLKFAYDESGKICSISSDASSIYPRDLSVVELPATKANLRVTLGDDWFYQDGKLQQIRDYQTIAVAERDSRMTEATKRINWLEAAQEDGDITAEEETELTALRTYRSELRRLDLSHITDEESYDAISWPEKPE